MTIEEMANANIKLVAERFLSNKCGTCISCEFSDITILIGNSHVTLCHLIYSILRVDRKQDIKIQSSAICEITDKGEIKCLK